MSFSVASYNVLASAYIQRAWYRRTPGLVLDPAWRVPALVQYVSKLGADMFCLQEVEPETFVALRTTLAELGFGGQYARKLAGRPDGVALFYRRTVFEMLSAHSLAYADGAGVAPDSGYGALTSRLRTRDGILGVINTHLAWDPPETARGAQLGLRQARQLLAELESGAARGARGWIVAGDFNVTPESEIVALMEQAGFQYAHRGLPGVFTCNVGAKARLIDYLFHSANFRAQPSAPTRIDDKTILPSVVEPSDHVAIMATFDWKD